MGRSIYIFSSGRLERKENTLVLNSEEGKRVIPITTVSDIKVFGEVDLNKRLLEFLTQNRIAVHFFNHYGYYVGSYYPREYTNSGLITLKQAEHYLDEGKRLYLAKSFVAGAIINILKNLEYYNRRKGNLKENIEKIGNSLSELEKANTVQELMSVEGDVRKEYYSAFNKILENVEFFIDKRTKRPPENPINALISFGNSLLYTTILSEIYHTHLDPRIGYLHETNQRSFSLNLDIAEIFKPVIVDRVIFSLVNRKQIQLKHFEKSLNYSYLTDKGKQIFITEFEEKLKTTLKYKNLGKVSYKKLIRLECYKLYKHFLGEETYTPYIGEG